MPGRVEVIRSERVFDQFFKIDRAELRYERFDGQMTPPITRLVFERGDAVAVLLYDRVRDQVILVQQFRYPAYVRGDPAWLWEVIAGVQEEGREAEDVARGEALEEAGYQVENLRYLMTVYSSPGGSSERIHLYLAPVTPARRVAQGGGLAEHGEDTRVQAFALDEALAMVSDGRIVDAKTVIVLQYLALHRDEF